MLRDLISKLLGLVAQLVKRDCVCICGEELNKVVNELQEYIEDLEEWMGKLERN